MGDKRALQAATSHFLGQNFARAFNIQYLDQQNLLQYVWTTSWGLSTRFIGAIIMTHGDDQGLIFPPNIAPIQIVIVPIYKNKQEKSDVNTVVERIRTELMKEGFKIKVDDREEVTPGFKFNDWEMRGIPLRIEVGPKDVKKGTVALARRDLPGKAGKSFVAQEDLSAVVAQMLNTIQNSMLERATQFRDNNIHDPKNYAELQDVVQDGWAFSWWCGDAACEAKIKEETKATARCIPLDQPGGKGKCIVCSKEADKKIYFARAY